MGKVSAKDLSGTVYQIRVDLINHKCISNYRQELAPTSDTIPPGKDVEPESQIPLPNLLQTEVNAIPEAGEAILVAGQFEYDDGFGHRVPFKYCFHTIYNTPVQAIQWIGCTPTQLQLTPRQADAGCGGDAADVRKELSQPPFVCAR